MPSNIYIMVGAVRTDLDDIFEAVGGSTPSATNTGFVSNGSDIRLRYYASTGGDQRAANTGLKNSSGVDLKTLLRDIAFSGAPQITVQPVATNINETSSGALTITATGDPTLTYQWRKGGVNMSNGGHYSGVTTTTMTISTASVADDADYDCVVSNGISPNATSSSVHVTVILIPVINGGSVESGPYSYDVGDVIALTVTTSAGQNLSYQWKLDGSNVGSNSSSHTFNLSTSNDGTYTVVVSNAAGSDTSSSCVVSIRPPIISGGTVCGGTGGSAPSGGGTYDFVDGGSVASFDVTTSQGTSLTYVWERDIGGGWVDLGINNAQGPVYNPAYIADSGVYRVTISNGGGTVSASVTMNVT